ncbi:MAG: DNA topoisomerase IB, partial [Chthoniobacterales bacterium]|nr:DNA topoisomerase IB [Chthoniobacterales bacterium]
SFGLTTLRSRHVKVEGESRIRFDFRGKSGTEHHIDLRNRKLAAIVRRCQGLPGQELFQYLDDEGQPQSVGSTEVNAYLKEISGEDFTAKDFRTWAGTVMAAMALQAQEVFENKSQAKKNLKDAISAVAKVLGNTPAVCRKCYVHPAVLESYLDGNLIEGLKKQTEETLAESLSDLRSEEAAVLSFLREKLAKKS